MSTVVMHNVVPVDGQHLLEDPDVVIKGDRVLHLRYRVRHQGGAA